MPYDYTYPQLYQVIEDVDYSRFDRFHINVSDEGVSVDEVMWVLSGRGRCTSSDNTLWIKALSVYRLSW